MSRRPRVFSLETLEGRQLLSHSASLPLGSASILAKQKTITMSINGTIAGTTGYYHNPSSFNETTAFFDASGNLPVLGLVQTTALIPDTGSKTQRGTMTLATSQGTLTFKVIDKPRSPTELTVQGGTARTRDTLAAVPWPSDTPSLVITIYLQMKIPLN